MIASPVPHKLARKILVAPTMRVPTRAIRTFHFNAVSLELSVLLRRPKPFEALTTYASRGARRIFGECVFGALNLALSNVFTSIPGDTAFGAVFTRAGGPIFRVPGAIFLSATTRPGHCPAIPSEPSLVALLALALWMSMSMFWTRNRLTRAP